MTNQPKIRSTARKISERVKNVCETPTAFSSVFATGVNTTVEAPNVQTITPVANPFLSMNHFCAQEIVDV